MELTYGDHLKNPHWQRLRLAVFRRDGWACVRCGAGLRDNPAESSTLYAHHLEYVGEFPWDTPAEKIETRCGPCHAMEHTPRPMEPPALEEWKDRFDHSFERLLHEARLIAEETAAWKDYRSKASRC